MAVYTTFFLCEAADLQSGFPGWRAPLAEPVWREIHNPLTDEVQVVETHVPWPGMRMKKQCPTIRLP
jgi:hypothetical protein